jgi:hypothetical protein
MAVLSVVAVVLSEAMRRAAGLGQGSQEPGMVEGSRAPWRIAWMTISFSTTRRKPDTDKAMW